MAKRYIKLAALVCMLFSLGADWMGAIAANTARKSQSPIRSVEVTIAANSRDRFVEQLRKFADANAFAMRVGESTPDGKHILVQLWREDIKIIGVNPFEPEAFRIRFYENGPEPPIPGAVDRLITSLRVAIGDLQGATFSEMK